MTDRRPRGEQRDEEIAAAHAGFDRRPAPERARVYAPGVCVRWAGYVSISETLGDGFVSKWGHCR